MPSISDILTYFPKRIKPFRTILLRRKTFSIVYIFFLLFNHADGFICSISGYVETIVNGRTVRRYIEYSSEYDEVLADNVPSTLHNGFYEEPSNYAADYFYFWGKTLIT